MFPEAGSRPDHDRSQRQRLYRCSPRPYHQLPRLDSGQDPSWQPVIYTADLLIPVVNLGQDRLWRTSGASAWVASVLTAVGWLLLSTGAAGATRTLTRR
jgi:hypothetical protein